MRHIVEHEHNDKVANRDCTDWVMEWFKWIFGKDYETNPLFLPDEKDIGAVEPDEEQGKIKKGQESVWFLVPPMLSYSTAGTIIKRVNLPLGRWHFLASPYLAYASKQLFPSVPANKLFNMAKNDVDQVYKLEITLDGVNLAGCRVPIKTPFQVNLPSNRNVLGLKSAELKNGNAMDMVSDGYWIWLKELPPGDHILALKGYSPLYRLDTEFHLYVRGRK
jgi:hypothetical protein